MPRITIKVTPNAKRTEFLGLVELPDSGTALGIKLKAPPVDGKANQALREVIAEALGVPKSAVSIVRGESSRLKVIEVAGVSEEAVQDWIASVA